MSEDHWLGDSPTSSPSLSPRPQFFSALPHFEGDSASPHPPSQHSWAHQSDWVYGRHDLPVLLNSAREADRLDIAYLCEACDVMQKEADIAERRYRQTILSVRAHQLRFLEARDRLQQALRERNVVIRVALQEVVNAPSNTDCPRHVLYDHIGISLMSDR
jgi:hypothetical protein